MTETAKGTAIRVCSVDEEGRFGGPECRITHIAKALRTRECGIETHVVYPSMDSRRFALELSRNEVPNTALNITRLSKEPKIFVKYILCFFPEIALLWKFFREGQYDLVQVNGSQQFKGAIAAKLAGIPVIWVIEDELMHPLVKRICVFLAGHLAAGIIVVGKKVFNYYVPGTPLESKPITEIHPPVDTIAFDPQRVAPEDSLHKITGEKIVTVSGINPTKGLEYFIEMAGKLKKKHKNLVFFVAAPNFNSQKKYFQYLQDLITANDLTEKDIHFLGMVDNIPSFLKGADIFVCTSISESGPIAVWEAMSMGKAIVSTDVGSVSDYLVDGESGFIVPIQDSTTLANKVETFLNDPALGERMGAKTREIVREHLDVAVAAGKYEQFYRKILQRPADETKAAAQRTQRVL